MKKFFYLFCMVVGSLWLLFFPPQVAANSTAFTVRTPMPSNSYHNKANSLNILLQKNQKQTINITIRNLTNDKQTLSVAPRTGYTNNLARIAYNLNDVSKKTNPTIKLGEVLTGPKTITLLPSQTKIVKYYITMPNKNYQGILIGALYFQNIKTADKKNAADKIHKVTLRINVRNQKSKATTANLSVKNTTLTVNHSKNDSPAIKLTLQNVTVEKISGATLTTSLSQNGNVLYQQTRKNRTIAPKSTFDYFLNLNNQEVKPGNYQLEFKVITKSRTWRYSTPLKISKTQATKINQTATIQNNDNLLWKLSLMAIIIIIFLTYYRPYRRTQR